MPLDTPVALIVFNRPELTARVFERIRRARPRRLFVIADGPRTPAEAAPCQAARQVTEGVDWPCEVQRDYAEKNLGCGRRPATGIDWVFSQVEEAILLEDDCVPSDSFFRFCETLLAHYRDEPRVMHISGNNFQGGRKRGRASYYFSKYSHNWGWATWRRAWRHFDYAVQAWPEFRESAAFHEVCPDAIEREFWTGNFDHVHGGVNDIWDAQWLFACWSHGGLAALPAVNLVSNIGFGDDATHTKVRDAAAEVPAGELGEIVHAARIVADEKADRHTFDTVFDGQRLRRERSLLTRARRRLHDARKKVLPW
jgi:hypothetical protein